VRTARRALAAVAVAAAAATLAAPASAAPRRVEVVVELRPVPVTQQVAPRLLETAGHLGTTSFDARLGLALVAREQATATARMQAAVPSMRVMGRLRYVMDALRVTAPPSQLGRLARVPGVAHVWPSMTYHPLDDRVPTVINAVPLWGTSALPGTKGDGMRIAIIDDGIDISRPSFSGVGYQYPPGFPKGITSATNGKIIVARAFPPPGGGPRTRTAFDSGTSQHGTHVAGIAAGNEGITGTVDGVRVPGISGVAPRAYLGNYRVLTVPTPGFGPDGNGAEIAQAIDQAVADGMDVLNLSIGEPPTAGEDVVEHAIARAARAGVLTVAAAGNEGDQGGNGTIDSPAAAPDAIATAAVTNDRFFGVPMRVLGPGAVPASLAAFGGAADVNTIPRTFAAGLSMVVGTGCGSGGRTGALVLVHLTASCNEARAVVRAHRGRGFVFWSDAPGDPLPPDAQGTRPEVQVAAAVARQLIAAARAFGGQIDLSVGRFLAPIVSGNGGLTVSFSSRGPAPDLGLKPEISAPGQDVVSPIPGGYGDWSGTSMASPAIAGAAALLLERHPSWGPAEVRSALMLTATPVFQDSARRHEAGPQEGGAGMANVAAADTPGLAMDPAAGVSFGVVAPGSTRSVTRSFRDIGGGAGRWSVEARGLSATGALVVPAGGSAELRLTLHARGARDHGGYVILRGAGHVLRVPWWGFVSRPLLATERIHPLRRGWNAADLRHGVRRVSRYRWPADPRGLGLPLTYPGPEQVFHFRVPAGAVNAGVRVAGAQGVVPQILSAPSENALIGATSLPVVNSPYLDNSGQAEPVSAVLFPRAGTLYVVVDSSADARPGPYRLRLWVNDVTPPHVTFLPGPGLRLRVTDTGSGVDFAGMRLAVDGHRPPLHVDAARGIVTARVRPGRHHVALSVGDWQETKNSENADPRALPNTAIIQRTVAVTG
jgi:subtilisin family serine protease